jgi:hypothetical protein
VDEAGQGQLLVADPAARRRVLVQQAHAAAFLDELAGGDQGVVSGADEDGVECRR